VGPGRRKEEREKRKEEIGKGYEGKGWRISRREARQDFEAITLFSFPFSLFFIPHS
jgi:hypothetical protein